ncbi:MAG: hypothetical protein NT068_03420 [Candidatus Nomurabacteria bacterium]|nr:hypothetical protein [Candidatus Nomurabacteria bacterium]
MKKFFIAIFALFLSLSVIGQTKSLYELLGNKLPAYGTAARTAMAVEAGITSGYIGSYDQNQKIAEYLQSVSKVYVKNPEIASAKKDCLKFEKTIVVPSVNATQNVNNFLSTDIQKSIANAEIRFVDSRLNSEKYQSMQSNQLLMIAVATVATNRTSDEEILRDGSGKFFDSLTLRQTLIYLIGKQPHGEKGILATNSNSNIFYVKKGDGSIYYISLGWSTDYGGWYLNYHDWITPVGSEWEYKGDKIFAFVYNPKNSLTSDEDSNLETPAELKSSVLNQIKENNKK